MTTPACRSLLAKKLGLHSGEDILHAILRAKSPGGSQGQFQHTTFVPGPSQLLGLCHMLLGEGERRDFVQAVADNRRTFCEELGLSHAPGTYYLIFDMRDLAGPRSRQRSAEDLLLALARCGVVYLPAVRFFPEGYSASPTLVRASVANAKREEIVRAAEITRQVLRT